jgi:hypothetical protein
VVFFCFFWFFCWAQVAAWLLGQNFPVEPFADLTGEMLLRLTDAELRQRTDPETAKALRTEIDRMKLVGEPFREYVVFFV